MTDGLPIPRAITHEANRWFTRRDAGLMTAEDEACLEAWLAADPRHARAFGEAERLFASIDAGAFRVYEQAASVRAHPPSPRRVWVRTGLAAGFAAGLVLLIAAGKDLPVQLQADYLTATGEQKRIALADGSVVFLNTRSAIAVDYGRERNIRLLRGEAAFIVAADRSRPFSVEAAQGRTTALGTRFIVDRSRRGETRVTVTEHNVGVSHEDERSRVVVPEGYSVLYDAEGIGRPQALERPSDSEAWMRGHIRFVNRPLGEVVAELNRYHKGRIIVMGRDLRALPVNGSFSATDTAGAVTAIEAALGLRSYRPGAGLIVLSAGKTGR